MTYIAIPVAYCDMLHKDIGIMAVLADRLRHIGVAVGRGVIHGNMTLGTVYWLTGYTPSNNSTLF